LWDRNLYSTDDYLRDYPYLLPKSGVLVGTEAADVTGADQGMFVLPQKTAGDNVKDGDHAGEFGLEVSYTVYGNPAGAPVFVQFSDLVSETNTESVTFETGRQYTLNLIFGAGGNDSDPFINIGAFVTFSPLNDEELDGPVAVPQPDPDHDPAATNFWAASNIYFKPEVQAAGDGDGTGDGDVGTLTFAESKVDGTTFGRKEGYQGVFFKWGSLIGISTNITGSAYDYDNVYLFIPNPDTGKYHKYKVGNVTSTPGDIIVNAYLDKANDNDWGSIPWVGDNTLPTGRDKNSLSDIYSPEDYEGDICRYLSVNRSVNGSGLVSEWRMPVSNMFAGDGDDEHLYPYESNGSKWERYTNWSGTGSFVGGQKENGTSQTADAFVVYTFPTGETVYFPASGGRYNSGSLSLSAINDHGNLSGVYWSSSADYGSNAYYPYFDNFSMIPVVSSDRTFSVSVRCVRSLAGE
jgi:hypothetical protein